MIAPSSQAIFMLERLREVKRLPFGKSTLQEISSLTLLYCKRFSQTVESTRQTGGAFVSHWNYYTPRLAAADVALSQWICHGHLADSHVWCAVAALLRHFGMPDTIARQVWSRKDPQFRTTTERWCQATSPPV